jgi:formylmethanofuran dehydrogenase subunit A
VNALQWAIGLEWMLTIDDPWRIALSTDHPNGASFLKYPQIIALLMNADLRRAQIRHVHASLPRHCGLHEIDREYSLEEIAIVTRAAPARLLGLRDKGHLGPGAVADVVIYDPADDPRVMFEFPRGVCKAGRLVVDDGKLLVDRPQANA